MLVLSDWSPVTNKIALDRMDILTHAISGTAVAACAATFVKPSPLKKVKILFVGTLGGIFPDIDAVSMWSKFDATIGQLFNLSYTGKQIYGMKLWYSHHAFFHSLLASILFGLLLLFFVYLINSKIDKGGKKIGFSTFLQNKVIYFITFVLGYWAHLAGDLPTPSSVWGGIALFWPSNTYIGGAGKIWWWNNYDIFLLICLSIVLILVVPLISKYIKKRSKIFSSLVLCLILSLILIQINTRKYDYAYKESAINYAKMEGKSKKEQERILGRRLYRYMSWFDSKLKFYF